MNTFVIYSKDHCPYCVKIKQLMVIKEFSHVVYTLDVDFNKEQFYDQFGQGSTFPQVVLNDTNLGGCTETIKYLKEHNMV
jgi:glutaredoxin